MLGIRDPCRASGAPGCGWGVQSPSPAQPSDQWLFASFPKVASDKSIYLGQIVSEKLPLELPGTKPAVGKWQIPRPGEAEQWGAGAAAAGAAARAHKGRINWAAAERFVLAPLSPRCGAPH